MFVRLCRYRILPSQLDRYLDIQRRASAIYQAHSSEQASYFQSIHDPYEWLEIHHYANHAACQISTARINKEPAILALWHEFQETLDPNVAPVVEEFTERGWFSGQSRDGNFAPGQHHGQTPPSGT